MSTEMNEHTKDSAFFPFVYMKEYIAFLMNSYGNELIDYANNQAKANLSASQLDLTEREAVFWDLLSMMRLDETPLSSASKSSLKSLLQGQFEIADCLLVTHSLKLSLLAFIPRYTQQQVRTLQIVTELEEWCNSLNCWLVQACSDTASKRAAERNQLMNGVLENLPVIISRFDEGGLIHEAVGSGLNRIGMHSQQLVGSNLFDLYPQATSIKRVLTERIPLVFEGSVGALEQPRHFLNYYFPLEKGGAIGFSIDITEQKEAEAKLRESQHFIQQVADFSPDILYVFDLLQMNLVYINREITDVLGYSESDLYSLGPDVVLKLMHPDDIDRVLSGLQSFFTAEDNVVKETEYRIRSKQGEWQTLLSREVVFKRDEKGIPCQILGISRDITEKKVAEEEIRYTNQLLSRVLNNLPISIGRIDRQGYFLESRGLGVRKFGSYDNQIVGWNVLEHFPSLVEPIRRVLQGETVNFIGSTSYDNRTIYFQNYAFFDQEKDCAIVLALEVTDLKEAEERLMRLNDELELKVQERTTELAASEIELRQALAHSLELNKKIANSEQLLSSMINQSPVSTWIADADGTQIRVNEACLKLFGVENASQGIGKYNILQDNLLIKEPYFEDIKAVFTEGTIAKIQVDYNVSQVHHVDIPTGVPITLVTTIFPLKDATGKVINAVIQHEDITRREQALRALRKSEEQLRMIADALPVLISYVDDQQRYQFNNSTYEQWYNIPAAQVVGKKVVDVVGEHIYQQVQDRIERVLAGEEIHFETELPYHQNETRYLSINYIPHFEGERVIGYFALGTDLTDRRQTEKLIEQALKDTEAKNQELIKLNEVLDNFVYMAAHDLKSPVTNLNVLVSMLVKAKDKNDKPELLKTIQASLARLDSTIQGMVEVIEIQSYHTIPVQEVYFQDILEVVLAECRQELLAIGGQVHTDFSAVKSIRYVKAYLLSILKNVLTNAIKYRSQVRPLSVSLVTSKHEAYSVLRVKDNGIGMDLTKYGQHLFKPFTRFTHQSEGKGLGLHLVKNMVEKNGGKVEVMSTVNEGTTFRIFFKDYEQ